VAERLAASPLWPAVQPVYSAGVWAASFGVMGVTAVSAIALSPFIPFKRSHRWLGGAGMAACVPITALASAAIQTPSAARRSGPATIPRRKQKRVTSASAPKAVPSSRPKISAAARGVRLSRPRLSNMGRPFRGTFVPHMPAIRRGSSRWRPRNRLCARRMFRTLGAGGTRLRRSPPGAVPVPA
jgi:hypothetical protein